MISNSSHEFINLNSHVLAEHILAKQHRTFNNLLQVYQKYKSAFGSLDIFYALHRFIPLFFFFLFISINMTF